MKTLILVAHPKEADSGTQAFLKQAVAGTEDNIKRRVLSNDITPGFVPRSEMKDVLAAERIIFQFPLYWYSAPAVLHQWFADCLITPYKEKLHNKELGLVVSTGRPEREFALGKKQKYSLSELLRPFVALADNLDMQMMPYFLISQFEYQTDKEHQKLLIDYLKYLELPKDYSFSDQEKWFMERLGRLASTKNDNERQLLNLISQQISDRSERLDEIKDEISMIKSVEEGDV
ncbi:NAD(P)H-dependent oxidoreductase [Ligilactobacillus pobuzihii]|uniref:Flavodoxin-like fold domain-containing protein n=1 Tax=Ligilactobacillus pobuzihii TaxID=449659 RepID=A0A0R2L6E7_9LACO|nr:NAD(P)H-dependent oxidoreductase [Ligilactobacillus pobuzihii]KRK10578.1 hypothetical protein FD11_GL001854 [Ligilactobacillus pobuzihii E100301 = KCTC 13174]KRN97385.1 hypothetical protein IV66_GL000519 [Ligilactobacillus pobuzihii]GEN48049.1 NAD(P)H dehydrogenase [Ligilactobacillus pobuzihii]